MATCDWLDFGSFSIGQSELYFNLECKIIDLAFDYAKPHDKIEDAVKSAIKNDAKLKDSSLTLKVKRRRCDAERRRGYARLVVCGGTESARRAGA